MSFAGAGKRGSDPLIEANPPRRTLQCAAMLRKPGKTCAFIGKVGGYVWSFAGRYCYEIRNQNSFNYFECFAAYYAGLFTYLCKRRLGFRFLLGFRAVMMLTVRELPKDLIRGVRILHFATLSMTHERGHTNAKKVVALAKDDSCRSQ